MTNAIKFGLPDDYDPGLVESAIDDSYTIADLGVVQKQIAFYDSFDWRLYNKSLVLSTSHDTATLRKLFKNDPLYHARMASAPVFVWDFPPGDLRQRLSPLIGLRALLKLIELDSRSITYSILNRHKKTVANLAFEEIRLAGGKSAPILASYLWVQPVRGYRKICRHIVRHLQQAGYSLLDKEDIYFKAMVATGKNPGDYSSKLKIILEPAMRSDEASKIILNHLLQILTINQAQLVKDLDTEFLHDFRVAVRRTRSALAQLKSVFPKDITERFKTDFSFVAKLTNKLRDLDVYLLNENEYRAMLPAYLREDIDPLFGYLKKKRCKIHGDVIDALESNKYREIIQDWTIFLAGPPHDQGQAPAAQLPIISLAKKRILKQYLRIAKDCHHALRNSDDRTLHTLRIKCKKLRYMLEFFRSLFPPKEIKIMISQLKTLQDYLGDFNDACVQQKFLLNIAEELPVNAGKQTKTFLAIGSLISILNSEKQRLIASISETLAGYASSSHKKAYCRLFGQQR